jgi:hypothetical protein
MRLSRCSDSRQSCAAPAPGRGQSRCGAPAIVVDCPVVQQEYCSKFRRFAAKDEPGMNISTYAKSGSPHGITPAASARRSSLPGGLIFLSAAQSASSSCQRRLTALMQASSSRLKTVDYSSSSASNRARSPSLRAQVAARCGHMKKSVRIKRSPPPFSTKHCRACWRRFIALSRWRLDEWQDYRGLSSAVAQLVRTD